MKCYYDSTQEAIGTCKSCGRGLSPDHLTEMDKGLACKNRCESDVRALIDLIDRNISSSAATNQILRRSSAAGYGSGMFLTMIGAVFTVTGLKEPEMDFTLYLGVGFLVYGIWTLLRTFRHSAILAKLPDSTDSNT